MSYPNLPSFQSATPYVHRPNKFTGEKKRLSTITSHTSSWNKHSHIAQCRWTAALTEIKIFHSARQSSLLSSGIPYSHLQTVTILDAVIIQFVLLKMGMLILETCRGL